MAIASAEQSAGSGKLSLERRFTHLDDDVQYAHPGRFAQSRQVDRLEQGHLNIWVVISFGRHPVEPLEPPVAWSFSILTHFALVLQYPHPGVVVQVAQSVIVLHSRMGHEADSVTIAVEQGAEPAADPPALPAAAMDAFERHVFVAAHHPHDKAPAQSLQLL